MKLNLFIISALVILTGCTKEYDLKRADFISLKVDVKGTHCAGLGDDLETPVKILMIVDVSASNYLSATGIGTGTTVGTDRPAGSSPNVTSQRQRAYTELIDTLIPTAVDYDPALPSNYHFGLITFSDGVYRMTTT